MKTVWILFTVAALVVVLSACTDAAGRNKTTPTAPVTTTEAPSTPSADPTTLTATDPTTPSATPTGTITRERALEIALAKAGLTADAVHDIDIELDRDDGVLHYDVDFETATAEYEFEIDAATGKLLTERPTEAASITRDAAINAALAHAGVAKNATRELSAELDRERLGTVWEVEFESGTWEYSYEIDAATGAVLRSEKEHND